MIVRYIAAALALALTWVTLQLFQERQAHAEFVAVAEAASAQAHAEARRVEQVWREKLEEVRENAATQTETLEAALARASVASGGLREQLAAIRERNTGGSPASCGGETTIQLLTQLLRQADALAGEYAEAADRNRIAGLACESAYNNLAEGAFSAGQSISK